LTTKHLGEATTRRCVCRARRNLAKKGRKSEAGGSSGCLRGKQTPCVRHGGAEGEGPVLSCTKRGDGKSPNGQDERKIRKTKENRELIRTPEGKRKDVTIYIDKEEGAGGRMKKLRPEGSSLKKKENLRRLKNKKTADGFPALEIRRDQRLGTVGRDGEPPSKPTLVTAVPCSTVQRGQRGGTPQPRTGTILEKAV